MGIIFVVQISEKILTRLLHFLSQIYYKNMHDYTTLLRQNKYKYLNNRVIIKCVYTTKNIC